ncbi:MAG: hypothetical protein PXY39_01045, partial [archaeon]|nr:hypothetical protein [archaeon]
MKQAITTGGKIVIVVVVVVIIAVAAYVAVTQLTAPKNTSVVTIAMTVSQEGQYASLDAGYLYLN